MLRLVYSNEPGELLAELAQRVRAQQLRDGPLAPVRIVAPSPGVDHFLRTGIAAACGVAANLEVQLPGRFVASLAEQTGSGKLADAQVFEGLVLPALVDDAALASVEMAPVKAYLYACGSSPEALDLRRAQLATRMGRLFEEYARSRGEMLSLWSQGRPAEGLDSEVEGWQRALWRSIAPPVLAFHTFASTFDPAKADFAALHVFMLSNVPRSLASLVERLASRVEVVLYALSPCEGFWEDVDAQDPDPLHLWGRPGREQVRLLNALAGFDHDDRFVDPLDAGRTPTLLRRLQSDIFHRRTVDLAPDLRRRLENDDSLVVLEHASIRRELEAVASDIWRLLLEDPTLRFDDVAVVVPGDDFPAYASQTAIAFRETHDIPFRTIGAASSSDVVEAVELLLALPRGRFTRQDLLRVASHPLVVPADSDPDRWAAWCEGLGIVHGADRGDHEGTYVTRDILSWDQGLRRLALGSFMAGDASGARQPFEVGGQSYVPLEVAPSEMGEAAQFGLLMRSLVEDARFARDAELSFPDWASFLCAFVESYVTPTTPGADEELARVLRSLHRLSDVDLGGRQVRYSLVAEIARARIAGAGGARQGDGVVLCTWPALEGLPFRAVFACGLGEGRFPSPETDDPLDLRWARRHDGDVSARERDRFAFLQVVSTARDRLAMSFVSRDTVTGQRLSPSSLVQELLHTLSAGYVETLDALRRRHPLRRWDPAYFPDLFPHRSPPRSPLEPLRVPEARAEATTLALRRSAQRAGARPSPEDVVERAERDAEWADLARHLMLTPLPEVVVDTKTRVTVPLYAIVKFLEFPLQAWARFRLGLDDREEDDRAAREHELFETEARDETLFLRGVLLAARKSGKPLAEAYDLAAREREIRGEGPSGAFSRAEREDHVATLEVWRAHLAEHGVDLDGLEVHRFGRGGETRKVDGVHDALVLDVDYTDPNGVTRVVQAELSGSTLPLGLDRSVSITLAKRKEGTDGWARAGRERAQLRAFVEQAMLAATGTGARDRHASLSVVVSPDGPMKELAAFEPLSRDEAASWLRNRVRELLSGPHAYFLPCEAVLLHAKEPTEASLALRIAEARNKLRDSEGPAALRSVYGPVPRPSDYPLPDEATVRETVEDRFGLFFAKRFLTQ
jgi:exodeoxyribonuclease V gamma subunit